jgi:hypothetical protein
VALRAEFRDEHVRPSPELPNLAGVGLPRPSQSLEPLPFLSLSPFSTRTVRPHGTLSTRLPTQIRPITAPRTVLSNQEILNLPKPSGSRLKQRKTFSGAPPNPRCGPYDSAPAMPARALQTPRSMGVYISSPIPSSCLSSLSRVSVSLPEKTHARVGTSVQDMIKILSRWW